MINRRAFLIGSITVTLLGSPLFSALAEKKKKRNLVVISLRGGMDGLSAVPPIDHKLEKFRPDILVKKTLPLTSDFALHRRAEIKEGQRILVNAAAGGVGLAAVELAKLSNAEVIAAVGSKEKAEFIKKYNPDLIINYREENLRETIEDKYGKRPINIFYDQVGGEPYEEGLRLLSSEGKALIVGFASGNIPSQLLSYLLVRNISLMGVFMISFENDDKEYLETRMKTIFDRYLSKEIKPIYKTINFDEIVKYLEFIGSRKTIGRIVALR